MTVPAPSLREQLAALGVPLADWLGREPVPADAPALRRLLARVRLGADVGAEVAYRGWARRVVARAEANASDYGAALAALMEAGAPEHAATMHLLDVAEGRPSSGYCPRPPGLARLPAGVRAMLGPCEPAQPLRVAVPTGEPSALEAMRARVAVAEAHEALRRREVAVAAREAAASGREATLARAGSLEAWAAQLDARAARMDRAIEEAREAGRREALPEPARRAAK